MTNTKDNSCLVNVDIAGKTFNIWAIAEDSYLGSTEACNFRSVEALAFKNTCINLLNILKINGPTCVLDVGANVGINSLVLGQLAQNRETKTRISKVVSFEPEPFTFICLEKNVKYFPNLILPINGALGERSRPSLFFKTPGSTSGSHLVTTTDFAGTANENVKVERLDYYVDKLRLQHVGLIKIDVEGHEKSVLRGAIGTIEKFNPWIYLEFNSWTLMAFADENPRDFLEYLLDQFQIVSVTDKITGALQSIKSRTEALAFLHNNLVFHGCVNDLVLRLNET